VPGITPKSTGKPESESVAGEPTDQNDDQRVFKGPEVPKMGLGRGQNSQWLPWTL
jgi:hypothetical protein